jgi:beta-glucanase (GH16 family)
VIVFFHSLLVVIFLALGAPGAPLSPAFSDDFRGGALDSSKWKVSNWHAPGTIPGRNLGAFTPQALDFSQGMLRIAVTQRLSSDGVMVSTGGEIQSRETFGYGTYEFVMRLASTSSTPDGAGRVVSGSDSGAFTFINNSESEIDIEFLGSTPDSLWLTNWVNSAHNVKGVKPTRYEQEKVRATGLADGFHEYAIAWTPGKVVWRIDGKAAATHTRNVPSAPAHIMISHWGTNHERWGGVATLDTPRYLYVRKVRFTPMAVRP